MTELGPQRTTSREEACCAGLRVQERPAVATHGAAAVIRNARMRWNLCWVNLRTGSGDTRYATYDTLEQMFTAIERGIAQFGDEFDVKRCFYGAEIDLDINMVVRVDFKAKP